MDKLDALRSFVEVTNRGSFTAAAEHLQLSRVQVSRHVQEVEQWLNLRLLHRTTRRVSLTSAGSDALVHCERLLNEAAALEASARSQQALQGDIRIAAPAGVGQNSLLDQLSAFMQLHPAVRVHLQLSDHNAQLVDERVDIALRFAVQPDEQLIARRLLAIDSVVCASPSYLAQHRVPNSPSELSQHRCLVHLGQQHWHFLHNAGVLAQPIHGQLFANDMGTLLNACLRGMGIALLPCDLAKPLLNQGKLNALLLDTPPPRHALWAVYLSRSYQQPLVRALIDYLAEHWQVDGLYWE
ncbi:LysR family transcriptional regulator [Atopomonas sediminilitoris]|uniref:LysR family transcriptional regulator n=1 Tax=Atopomonas sediminilitoris TaxID=2919919 RepID=UPI001F4E60DD|nr:LysR family transcriptional regulator [Atopomonas sediminilitoris]MCJ8168502.1 LysR family transcriptional regulator [Atopomonas sediminilitoris]